MGGLSVASISRPLLPPGAGHREDQQHTVAGRHHRESEVPFFVSVVGNENNDIALMFTEKGLPCLILIL